MGKKYTVTRDADWWRKHKEKTVALVEHRGEKKEIVALFHTSDMADTAALALNSHDELVAILQTLEKDEAACISGVIWKRIRCALAPIEKEAHNEE